MRITQRMQWLAALMGSLGVAALMAGWGGIPAHADEADPDTDYGRMLLLLDSSGSMKEPAAGGTSKIEAAKQALGQVVDDLPADADVGLRVFGATVFSREQRGACTDSQLVVEPGTDNREDLRSAIGDYTPYGETPIAHALQAAADDLGSEGTRSIVLVSDGIATCPPDPCRVAASLAKRGIDLQIDVVGLGVDAAARSQLRCIAGAGNGTYYDADSAEDIVSQLEVVATRAVRPFEIDGTPVRGGTDTAPTPLTVGLWRDEIGSGDDGSDAAERWYRVERTIPGSTLHVGVSSLGGAEGWDTLEVALYTEDGDRCNGDAAIKQVVSGQLLGVGASAGPEASNNDACADGPVLVGIGRALDSAGGRSPYSLQVLEEPPVEDVASLPPEIGLFDEDYVAPSPGGPTRSVTGGSSFGTATEIGSGRWRGDILPGETQVFAVEVGYGQTLRARVVTPASRGRLADEVGVQGPFATLQLHTPVRTPVPTVGSDQIETSFAAGSSAHEMKGATTEVRYRNREGTNPAHLAGTYYVAYSTDEDPDGRSYEMPYTLELEVAGGEQGAPTYVGGAELLETPAATPEEEETASPAETPSASTDPSGTDAGTRPAGSDEEGTDLRLLAAGGLGAVALAAVGVGVLLLRRSGSARQD